MSTTAKQPPRSIAVLRLLRTHRRRCRCTPPTNCRPWRGEHASHESARDRLYTAIKRLRQLGLRGLLHRQLDGYLLEPRLNVTYAGE